MGFPGGSVVKNPHVNAGGAGSIPSLGTYPGEGNGNSLQYSCLGNRMDRGAWQATVHGVTKRVRHDLATKQLYHSSLNSMYTQWFRIDSNNSQTHIKRNCSRGCEKCSKSLKVLKVLTNQFKHLTYLNKHPLYPEILQSLSKLIISCHNPSSLVNGLWPGD